MKNLAQWKESLEDVREILVFLELQIAKTRQSWFRWFYRKSIAETIAGYESEIKQFKKAEEFALKRIHEIEMNVFTKL